MRPEASAFTRNRKRRGLGFSPPLEVSMSVDSTQETMKGYFDAIAWGWRFRAILHQRRPLDDAGDRRTGPWPRCSPRLHRDLHTQIFDAKPEVKNVIVADGAALVEADFVGTHIRDFAGIPATGTKLRVPYCVVYDVSDDGITALRAYIPIAAMIARLQADTDSS